MTLAEVRFISYLARNRTTDPCYQICSLKEILWRVEHSGF